MSAPETLHGVGDHARTRRRAAVPRVASGWFWLAYTLAVAGFVAWQQLT
jgi:hypothetical protein